MMDSVIPPLCWMIWTLESGRHRQSQNHAQKNSLA